LEKLTFAVLEFNLIPVLIPTTLP